MEPASPCLPPHRAGTSGGQFDVDPTFRPAFPRQAAAQHNEAGTIGCSTYGPTGDFAQHRFEALPSLRLTSKLYFSKS